MSEWLIQNFKGAGFMPHGYCFLWNPQLIGLHLLADILITVAYMIIPIFLFYFTSKKEDLPFKWVVWLFGAFILSCGFTHMFGAWTLWNPSYWAQGILKLITGLISVATAIVLVPLMPKILSLPASKNPPSSEEEINRLQVALKQSEDIRKELELKLNQAKTS